MFIFSRFKNWINLASFSFSGKTPILIESPKILMICQMFVAQNESDWNVLLKAMKYVTAMTYRGFYVGLTISCTYFPSLVGRRTLVFYLSLGGW